MQDRAVPLQIGAQTASGDVVVREQRHVRRTVRERRSHGAIGALLRNLRRVREPAVPLRNRRRCTETSKLLHGAGKPGVVECISGQRGLRHILKDADATAHYGAWAAYRTIKRADLRGSTDGPREPDTWTEVHAIRNRCITSAEQPLDFRILQRAAIIAIAIDAKTILNLQVLALAPRVAKRECACHHAAAAFTCRELARERHRTASFQIGQRIE